MKQRRRIPWGPIVATGIMFAMVWHWREFGLMVGGTILAITLENMPEPDTGECAKSQKPDTEEVSR